MLGDAGFISSTVIPRYTSLIQERGLGPPLSGYGERGKTRIICWKTRHDMRTIHSAAWKFQKANGNDRRRYRLFGCSNLFKQSSCLQTRAVWVCLFLQAVVQRYRPALLLGSPRQRCCIPCADTSAQCSPRLLLYILYIYTHEAIYIYIYNIHMYTVVDPAKTKILSFSPMCSW